LLDCFELRHFHLGSQISAIRSFKSALREADASTSSSPRPERRCLPRRRRRLGVDYDGSQTNFASSMNYTMQEYANDIVFRLKEMCDAAGVATPPLCRIGRAIVAHHAVLVVDVLGTLEFETTAVPEQLPPTPPPW